MILFLHNRYRTTGGEERVLEDLIWLVREHLHEPADTLARDSRQVSRGGAAAALLRGGTGQAEVAAAVRRSGARIVHAHNLHPTFGWRALAAARAAGARVVLHLHQYRLVCATGVCFSGGGDCVRCHGQNTLPGVVRNCRGSRPEAVAYGAALALWQRRIAQSADAVIVPSEFARRRLQELGAPLPTDRVHVLPPPIRALAAQRPSGPDPGGYALVVSRLAPEKGVDVAVQACARADRPLVVAGDGPEREKIWSREIAAGRQRPGGAPPPPVRLLGEVSTERLRELRAGAAVALAPSRSAETFGVAAAEAMAAGLPVAGSDVGALGELISPEGRAAPGDSGALAAAMERVWGDAREGMRGRGRVQERCAPEAVAAGLAAVYERALGA